MTNEDTSVRQEEPVDTVNPLQIRLLDLFALMTLVALVSAMAAPFLRGFDSEYRNRLLLVIGLQLLIVVGTIVHYARKRKKLLEQSGPKIGAAFCGQWGWRYWPVTKSLLLILLLVFVQIFVAMTTADDLLQYGLLIPLYNIQLSWFMGYAFSLYRWRVYPNSVEFFENGISQKGTSLIRWECVEVRRSSSFSDKMVLVLRMSPDSIVGSTLVAQVSDQLRERIFVAANTQASAKQ